jgi:hypothetical protein
VLFRRLPQSPYLILLAFGPSPRVGKRRFDKLSNLELAEIARVFVGFNHVARLIVNPDHSIM